MRVVKILDGPNVHHVDMDQVVAISEIPESAHPHVRGVELTLQGGARILLHHEKDLPRLATSLLDAWNG